MIVKDSGAIPRGTRGGSEAGKENPEQAVIDSYKTRSLRIGITRTRMTDEEWNMLMSVLDENDQACHASCICSRTLFTIDRRPTTSPEY